MILVSYCGFVREERTDNCTEHRVIRAYSFSKQWSRIVVKVIHRPIAMALAILALANGAWAGNPWSSAIGEASAVQHRAEDIAKRIQKIAPHSYLVREAMALDHLACGLVDRVKCGAPCNQVEGLYRELNGDWTQLRVAIYTDPCLCSDRHLKSLADGMDIRMRNLCKAIERVIAREFRYRPSIGYHVQQTHGLENYEFQSYRAPSIGFPSAIPMHAIPPMHSIQIHSAHRIPFGVPSNSIHFGVPPYAHRLSPYQGYGQGYGQGHSGPGNWRAF